MLDKINSILIDQMDIASDSEKFLIGSSKRTTFNGTVRYLVCLIVNVESMFNLLCFKFELKQMTTLLRTFPSELSFECDYILI